MFSTWAGPSQEEFLLEGEKEEEHPQCQRIRKKRNGREGRKEKGPPFYSTTSGGREAGMGEEEVFGRGVTLERIPLRILCGLCSNSRAGSSGDPQGDLF